MGSSGEIKVCRSLRQELFDQTAVVVRDACEFGTDPALEVGAEVIGHRAEDNHHDEKRQQQHPHQNHPADAPEPLSIPLLFVRSHFPAPSP